MAQLTATIHKYSDRVLLVSEFSDVEKAKRESKIGILANFGNLNREPVIHIFT